jgi:hypothetical protein
METHYFFRIPNAKFHSQKVVLYYVRSTGQIRVDVLF